MKKRFAITGLLVTLALGSIIGAHFWINGTGHNIKIDETTLSGNLDAAKGWQVTTKVQTTGTPTGGPEGKIYYHNFGMSWETAATIADSIEVNSKNIRGEDFSEESHRFDMDFLLTSGGSHWETNLLNEVSSHFKIPMPLLQEIADKIGPGESIEKTVNLKEYMDTVRATCSMESYNPINGEDLTFMTGSEYDFVKQFVVEVPENYPVTITLAKDEDGAVKSFHYVTLTETSDSFASLVTDDYLYVAINGYREDDTGEFHGLKLKRVSGILQLPLTASKEIDVEHMKKVYDIPAGIFIEKLSISEDGSKLLLITTEEETTYLSVIDKETMTLEQKVSLDFDTLEKHETISKIYIHEDSVTAIT
ncbi:MAG: hypothetical protein IKU44_02235, partial [Firmicutes bacterium]|nr:hypothetical protein [Bacillota bacterium]